jgi:hypothetical protein
MDAGRAVAGFMAAEKRIVTAVSHVTGTLDEPHMAGLAFPVRSISLAEDYSKLHSTHQKKSPNMTESVLRTGIKAVATSWRSRAPTRWVYTLQVSWCKNVRLVGISR